jgi:hypothetical protein
MFVFFVLFWLHVVNGFSLYVAYLTVVLLANHL